MRLPDGESRARGERVRRGGRGRRSRVRRARRRRRGGRCREADHGAARRPACELGAELLGPNCMGFFGPAARPPGTGRPQDTTAPGHVAVVCQSGSIADAFLSLGGRIGLRCVVSSGAEAVTDAADYLAFFAHDPETRAIGLFLETVRRPQAFVDALRACAEAGKPVACLKVGRSDAAARAALSRHGSARRLRPRVLGRAPPLLRDRGRRLPRARRDAGDPRSPAASPVDASPGSPSPEASVRCSRTRRMPPGSRSSRCRRSSPPPSPTRSRTTSPPETRSTRGASPTRPRSTRARSSCWRHRATSTSSSRKRTSRSSATTRTTSGAS